MKRLSLSPVLLCLSFLALLLAACTTDGQSTPAPTFSPPTLTATPAPPEAQPPAPTPEAIQPADATVLPEIVLDLTPPPLQPTATLESLSRNCLNPGDYEPMVNRYMLQQGKEDLKELWEAFIEENPVYDLMSSLTDVTNEYAHATTDSRMLLVGEYKIAINRPGVVGYAHCAVLIYLAGDQPRVGTGVLDATLNDAWSGFAYGNVRSEPDMRAYVRQRIGRPVIVRYQVSQDPRDVNFVRSGFFSPVMKLLWADSYFTRFSANPDMLKDNLNEPRGPGIADLMELLSAWPETDIGVFLDYMIDPIL